MLPRAILQSRLSGVPPHSGHALRLPTGILTIQDRSCKRAFSVSLSLRQALRSFTETYDVRSFAEEVAPAEVTAYEELRELLQTISSRLATSKDVEGGAGREEEDPNELEFSRAFAQPGGAWEDLLGFVLTWALPVMKRGVTHRVRKRHASDVANGALSVLKDLTYNVPDLAEALGANSELVNALVHGMLCPPVYEMCGMLCEELCNRQHETFDLRRIRNLTGIVKNMNACQLLFFCRVVSMIAMDAEERSGQHAKSFDLLNQRREMAIAEKMGGDVVALNQKRLLVETPELVARLLYLLDVPLSDETSKVIWLSRDPKRCWTGMAEPIAITGGPPLAVRLTAVPPEMVSYEILPEHARPMQELRHDESNAERPIGLRDSLQKVLRKALKWVTRDSDDEDNPNEAGGGGGLVKILRSFMSSASTWFMRRKNLFFRTGSAASMRSREEANLVRRNLLDGMSAVRMGGGVVGTTATDQNNNDDDDDGQVQEDDETEPNETEADEFLEDDDYESDDEASDFLMNPLFWNHLIQRDLWLLSQRLEITYVLCTLCIGPHKRLVQDLMYRHHAIVALVHRFDTLVWDHNFHANRLPAEARLHGAGCACDPHSGLKSQLLRLIHNFCDREAGNVQNKLTLFTEPERESWKWDFRSELEIDKAASANLTVTGEIEPHQIQIPQLWAPISIRFPPGLPTPPPGTNEASLRDLKERDAVRRARMAGLPGGVPANRGLAWRIAAVLVSNAEPEQDASLRFWISAALEALLRGSPVEMKLMISSWGVLRAVYMGIIREAGLQLPEAKLRSEERSNRSAAGGGAAAAAAAGLDEENNEANEEKSGILQTSFDLLGELVKENPYTLSWLCGNPIPMFGPCPDRGALDRLCQIAMDHLVDGNVFLRAVTLCYERSDHETFDLSPCETWVRGQHCARVLHGLWTAVKLKEVSQENLCCLNTAVILLTFARRRNELSYMLENVNEAMSTWSQQTVTPKQEADIEKFRAQLQNVNPKENFRKLLWYWRCYYSCRKIDRLSLEMSSGINFGELSAAVDEIVPQLLPVGVVLYIPYKGRFLNPDVNLPPIVPEFEVSETLGSAWSDF